MFAFFIGFRVEIQIKAKMKIHFMHFFQVLGSNAAFVMFIDTTNKTKMWGKNAKNLNLTRRKNKNETMMRKCENMFVCETNEVGAKLSSNFIFIFFLFSAFGWNGGISYATAFISAPNPQCHYSAFDMKIHVFRTTEHEAATSNQHGARIYFRLKSRGDIAVIPFVRLPLSFYLSKANIYAVFFFHRSFV